MNSTSLPIVVVEDDALLAEVLVQRLKSEGFEVSLVIDGRDAIETIEQKKPVLVLLGIVLPTVDGYEILKRKRANASIAAIPVIVISNSGQPVEISRIVSEGVNDYFVKADIDLDEVITRVKSILGKGNVAQKSNMATTTALSKRHILWVEDDPLIIKVITKKAENIHAAITQTADGEEALKIARDKKPDIIVLDVLLPSIDGFEILKKLKEESATKNIPVIILSNMSQQSDFDKAKQYGAVEYLVKAALTVDQVFSEIKGVLEKKDS